MNRSRIIFALLAGGALTGAMAAQGMRGGTQITPGQDCPPGTTEVRPGSCQQPSEPPPSILDYRPRSTLVTAEHKVPKAKFPAVDVHGHPGNLTTPDAINRVIGVMDSLNLKVMLVAENVSGDRLTRTLEALNASPHKEHHQTRWFAPQGRRSRTGSAVGGLRAAGRPGLHSYRRTAGVLSAARLQERTVARAVAVRRPAQQPARPGDF